jgi:hypothetical protein
MLSLPRAVSVTIFRTATAWTYGQELTIRLGSFCQPVGLAGMGRALCARICLGAENLVSLKA